MMAQTTTAPLAIPDVAAAKNLDPVSRQVFQEALQLRALMLVPLAAGGQLWGWLLAAATRAPYHFTEREWRVYRSLADQAALVLQSIRLMEEVTQRAERERRVTDITAQIRRNTDVDTILQTAIRELGRTLRASDGLIRLGLGADRHVGILNPCGFPTAWRINHEAAVIHYEESAQPDDRLCTGVAAVDHQPDGDLAYILARQNLTDSVFNRLESVVTLKEDELQRWVADQRQNVTWMAGQEPVRRWTAQLLQGDVERATVYTTFWAYLRAAVTQRAGLRELFVLSVPEGQVLISSTQAHEGQSQAAAEYFIQGRAGIYVQTIYVAEDGEPTITIANPIFNAAGECIGVLAAHLNLERMQQIILEGPGMGARSEVFLVDGAGDFVVAPPRVVGRRRGPGGVDCRGTGGDRGARRAGHLFNL
jgi:GAF domain-containing protein